MGTILLEQDFDFPYNALARFLDIRQQPMLSNGSNFPKIEFFAEKNEAGDITYVIQAAVAGYSEDEIDIHIDNNERFVEIASNIKQQKNPERKYFCSEIKRSNFKRQIYLPDYADSKKTEATYRDGILVIKMPHSNEHQTMSRIAINK